MGALPPGARPGTSTPPQKPKDPPSEKKCTAQSVPVVGPDAVPPEFATMPDSVRASPAVGLAGCTSSCPIVRSAAEEVAVNVTVSFAPGATTCTLFVPGAEPSVQLPSLARPLGSVVRTTVEPPVPMGGVMLPPPETTSNLTVAFAIGCGGIGGTWFGLPGSSNCTEGGAPTTCPGVPTWGSAETLPRVTGNPHVQ